ncbi:hypothetical protein AOXY_G374 [Acipenser oxyrinchus oxyrinchus]|uniref:Uncharacterized protein n=1 Tax=Acipenser oxyrinchus oxyrinchus TaxID=40147 RepID=A0AAD8GK76_ACIOX|nr:hypothetical protein AOXY_G374 [Acipenser oxyrinchus oxyrinchus]
MPLRVHWYKFNCLMIGSGPAVNHLCHGCRLENDLIPISHLNLMMLMTWFHLLKTCSLFMSTLLILHVT